MNKGRTIQRDKSHILAEACHAIESSGILAGAGILAREYPFIPTSTKRGTRTPEAALKIFCRDGFIDRYSGAQLIFTPALRVISHLLPDQLPYHPNWRSGATHIAYWEMSASLDHVIPLARGGSDNESNIVTTSWTRNSAKSAGTLEELGWELHPPGQLESWDGLTQWFVRFGDANPGIVRAARLAAWHRAAKNTLRTALTDKRAEGTSQ